MFLPGTKLAKNKKAVVWSVRERTIFQTLNDDNSIRESVVLCLFTTKGAKKIIHEQDVLKEFMIIEEAA